MLKLKFAQKNAKEQENPQKKYLENFKFISYRSQVIFAYIFFLFLFLFIVFAESSASKKLKQKTEEITTNIKQSINQQIADKKKLLEVVFHEQLKYFEDILANDTLSVFLTLHSSEILSKEEKEAKQAYEKYFDFALKEGVSLHNLIEASILDGKFNKIATTNPITSISFSEEDLEIRAFLEKLRNREGAMGAIIVTASYADNKGDKFSVDSVDAIGSVGNFDNADAEGQSASMLYKYHIIKKFKNSTKEYFLLYSFLKEDLQEMLFANPFANFIGEFTLIAPQTYNNKVIFINNSQDDGKSNLQATDIDARNPLTKQIALDFPDYLSPFLLRYKIPENKLQESLITHRDAIYKGVYTNIYLFVILMLAGFIAIRFIYFYNRNILQEQTVKILINSMQMKSPYLANHHEKMARIALKIGKELGFNPHERGLVYYAAIISACTKFSLPEDLLNKKEQFTEQEYAILQKHITENLQLMQNLDFALPIKNVVNNIYEKCDGTGFPRGLTGSDIPVYAKVITVADAFIALTNARPHRKAFSKREAILEMQKNSQQYDEMILRSLRTIEDDL